MNAGWLLLAFVAIPAICSSGAHGQAFIAADGSRAEHVAWRVEGDFKRGKDISGLACAGDESCFAVTDEKSAVLPFSLDRTRRALVVAGPPVDLPSGGEEADIEAAAFHGEAFYFVGSHGMSRSGCERQASRYRLYRAMPGLTPGSLGRVDFSAKLEELMAQQARLAPHVGRCLGNPDNGVDIEGLAVRDGMVQVGFRAPSLDGKAFVLSASTEEFFRNEPADPSGATLHELVLGEDTGVRDMVPVDGGLLILAGPSAGEGGRFSVYLWDGRASAVRLGALKDLTQDGADAKAEGLMLLEATEATYDVLVVFDGVKNGWPQEFRIPRPR